MAHSFLKVLVEMNGDDCLVEGEIVASITYDDDLTQPWVVKINDIEVHRRNTWALAYDYVRSHAKYGTLPNPQPVMLEVAQPANLPVVGQTHFIGDRLLKCVQVGGEYAAVWDVLDNGVPMGEISMDWDCFWCHNLSINLFATPQEAVADLCESAASLIEKPRLSRKRAGKVVAALSAVSVILFALAIPAYAQDDWCGKSADRREGCPVSVNH